MLSGIVLNAILFQKGRHPAPLFGSTARERGAQLSTASIPLPLPRPPVADPAPVQGSVMGQGKDIVASVPPSRPVSGAGSSRLRKEDGITQLLRGDAKIQPPDGGAKSVAANVLAAQHALRKIGYDVPLDGHMGTATRQALDRFEHDHHLAVGLELTPKLLHELGSSSGPPPG